MQILRKIAEFRPKYSDMITIYTSYIRSILEQSCQVWHSSLTQENAEDLERVQRSALRIILDEKFISYEHSLEVLNLETLAERRKKLCLNFAQKCLKNEKTFDMFPKNSPKKKTRKQEIFKVNFASTERLKRSSIPYMQRLLNEETS